MTSETVNVLYGNVNLVQLIAHDSYLVIKVMNYVPWFFYFAVFSSHG